MAFTQEEEAFVKQQEDQMRLAMSENAQGKVREVNNNMFLEEKEKGMIKEQLDLTEELEMIEHLLKGEELKSVEENGITVTRWTAPDNKDMILFSDHGVSKIMQTIQWYINKNTLLSNFDEETILVKMEDFSIALVNNIFTKYEKYFKYPEEGECQKELKDRLERKAQRIAFIKKERDGIDVDKEEVYRDLLNEIDIDREITVIKEQRMKDKLKDFDLITRCIQDAVHSTYNRAFQGQERRSLRQHMTITENKGYPSIQSQESKLNPLNWFSKR